MMKSVNINILDMIKIKMSEFINQVRVENKLPSENIIWDGLNFEYQ